MTRLFGAALAFSIAAAADTAPQLTLATWNLEWMMTPATFDSLASYCSKPGHRARGEERSIPCDLVPKARWSDEDLGRLREFASKLPADVIALQEIDGVTRGADDFSGPGILLHEATSRSERRIRDPARPEIPLQP